MASPSSSTSPSFSRYKSPKTTSQALSISIPKEHDHTSLLDHELKIDENKGTWNEHTFGCPFQKKNSTGSRNRANSGQSDQSRRMSNEGIGAQLRVTKRRQAERTVGIIYTPTARERLQVILKGKIGVYMDLINTTLSMMACLVYLLEVYDTRAYEETSFFYFEVVMALYFLLDYLVHLFAAEDITAFIFDPMSIIDIVTIIPSFILVFSRSESVRALVIIRLFKVFRALRILRLQRLVSSRKGGYNYELFILIISISAIVFVAAGIVHALDEEAYLAAGRAFEFHDAVYFILVTLSTVGYGDFAPQTTTVQFFVMALIVLIFTIVPKQIAKINSLARVTHSYDRSYDPKEQIYYGHVVVTGTITERSAQVFLEEFYHPTRGVINLHVIFISPKIPNKELLRMCSSAKYSSKVYILKGSLMREDGRRRCNLEKADAVFVIADKRALNPNQEDATTILRALSVRNFSDSIGKKIGIYIQVMATEETSSLAPMVGVDHIVNFSALKSAMLARSLVCPGACALLLNLMRSTSPELYDKSGATKVPWIAQYVEGMGHQIYPIILSKNYDGQPYSQAAKKVFGAFNAILLAVYNRGHDAQEPQILLSPTGTTLHAGDLCFVIAKSAAVAHDVAMRYMNMELGGRVATNSTLRFTRESLLRRQSPRSHISLKNIFASPASTDPAFGRVGSSKTLSSLSPHQEDTSASLSPTYLRRHESVNLLPRVEKTASNIDNHILICGSVVNYFSLPALAGEFYSKHQGSEHAVVVLTTKIPTAEEWRKMGQPPNVYFIEGSPMIANDLVRAGVFRAHKVLAIPGDRERDFGAFAEEVDATDDEHLVDYGVTMSLFCLETVLSSEMFFCESTPTTCRNGQSNFYSAVHQVPAREHPLYAPYFRQLEKGIPVETVQAHFIQHLPNADPNIITQNKEKLVPLSTEDLDYNLQGMRYGNEEVSSSRLWATSTLAVIDRVENIRFCRPRDPNFNSDTMHTINPSYAAGRIYVDAHLDLLVCQEYYNPYMIALMHKLLGHTHSLVTGLDDHGLASGAVQVGEGLNGSSNSFYNEDKHLFQIGVPPYCQDREFETVFTYLLSKDLLAIGIYRAEQPELKNLLPYVYTCPASETIVHADDMIFVIGKPAVD